MGVIAATAGSIGLGLRCQRALMSKGSIAFITALIVYALVSLYAYQQDKEMEQMAKELGVELEEE